MHQIANKTAPSGRKPSFHGFFKVIKADLLKDLMHIDEIATCCGIQSLYRVAADAEGSQLSRMQLV